MTISNRLMTLANPPKPKQLPDFVAELKAAELADRVKSVEAIREAIKSVARDEPYDAKDLKRWAEHLRVLGLSVEKHFQPAVEQWREYEAIGGDSFEVDTEEKLSQLRAQELSAQGEYVELRKQCLQAMHQLRILNGGHITFTVSYDSAASGQIGALDMSLRNWRQWKAYNPLLFSNDVGVAIRHKGAPLSNSEVDRMVNVSGGVPGGWLGSFPNPPK